MSDTRRPPAAMAVALVAWLALGCGGSPVDFTPTASPRSQTEAEEAFRRLAARPSEAWAARDSFLEERDAYTLVIYNAGRQGAALVEGKLASSNERERSLARKIISRMVTQEEGWHRHQRLVRHVGHEFERVAVRRIAVFIDAPEPDLGMLYKLFMGNVHMFAAGVEDAPEIHDHPLHAWFERHHDALACDWFVEDEGRRRRMVAIWRSWAADHAARFAEDLADFQRRVTEEKRRRWPDRVTSTDTGGPSS